MSTSVRKRLLAALDAAHRILNESDEFEAENATAKSNLEASEAALAQVRTQLATAQSELNGAQSEHERWLKATDAERLRVTGEMNRLEERLRQLLLF